MRSRARTLKHFSRAWKRDARSGSPATLHLGHMCKGTKPMRGRMNLHQDVKRIAIAITAAAAFRLTGTVDSQADDGSAAKILKSMADYIGHLNSVSATFDSDIEVITNNLQKIQFTSSGQVLLSRPDKLRASRLGGYADVELVFDGK